MRTLERWPGVGGRRWLGGAASEQQPKPEEGEAGSRKQGGKLVPLPTWADSGPLGFPEQLRDASCQPRGRPGPGGCRALRRFPAAYPPSPKRWLPVLPALLVLSASLQGVQRLYPDASPIPISWEIRPPYPSPLSATDPSNSEPPPQPEAWGLLPLLPTRRGLGLGVRSLPEPCLPGGGHQEELIPHVPPHHVSCGCSLLPFPWNLCSLLPSHPGSRGGGLSESQRLACADSLPSGRSFA